MHNKIICQELYDDSNAADVRNMLKMYYYDLCLITLVRLAEVHAGDE